MKILKIGAAIAAIMTGVLSAGTARATTCQSPLQVCDTGYSCCCPGNEPCASVDGVSTTYNPNATQLYAYLMCCEQGVENCKIVPAVDGNTASCPGQFPNNAAWQLTRYIYSPSLTTPTCTEWSNTGADQGGLCVAAEAGWGPWCIDYACNEEAYTYGTTLLNVLAGPYGTPNTWIVSEGGGDGYLSYTTTATEESCYPNSESPPFTDYGSESPWDTWCYGTNLNGGAVINAAYALWQFPYAGQNVQEWAFAEDGDPNAYNGGFIGTGTLSSLWLP